MSVLKALRGLPLHPDTITLIERNILSNPKTKPEYQLQLHQLLERYESARKITTKNKTIEQIIYTSYFQWFNTVPPYLKVFETRYDDLHNYWPIDKDSEHIHDRKVPMLRDLWLKNDDRAVDYTLEYMLKQDSCCPTDIFEPIFGQFQFIMKNPQIQRRKIGKTSRIPILLLPLNVLGEDIAACRSNNLLRRQINEVRRILVVDNPILDANVAEQLLQLSNNYDRSMERKVSRRYYLTSKLGYTWIKPNSNESNENDNNGKPQLSTLTGDAFTSGLELPQFASFT